MNKEPTPPGSAAWTAAKYEQNQIFTREQKETSQQTMNEKPARFNFAYSIKNIEEILFLLRGKNIPPRVRFLLTRMKSSMIKEGKTGNVRKTIRSKKHPHDNFRNLLPPLHEGTIPIKDIDEAIDDNRRALWTRRPSGP
jgi:hypothetical protein